MKIAIVILAIGIVAGTGPADIEIENALPIIAIAENEYLQSTGRFFQGLPTHTIVPGEDNMATAETDTHPQDQISSWGDLGISPGSLPSTASIRIDTYSGPQGNGYVVIAQTTIDGHTWQRTISVGPEEWRGSEWQIAEIPQWQ